MSQIQPGDKVLARGTAGVSDSPAAVHGDLVLNNVGTIAFVTNRRRYGQADFRGFLAYRETSVSIVETATTVDPDVIPKERVIKTITQFADTNTAKTMLDDLGLRHTYEVTLREKRLVMATSTEEAKGLALTNRAATAGIESVERVKP